MNFSVTSLEKKTKGSFLKLFKKQGGAGIEFEGYSFLLQL